MENTLTLLYAQNEQIEPVCREKLVTYIKAIDEKGMKSVKDFFLEAIANFKAKFPTEYEASDLPSILPST